MKTLKDWEPIYDADGNKLCACGCGRSMEGKRLGAKWFEEKCAGYARSRNAGRVEGRIGRPPREELYVVDGATGCWNWLLGCNADGRPIVTRGGRTRIASRWMYEKIVGPVPLGCQLHHACENLLCVRPDPKHLVALTPPQHAALHSRKGRARRKLTQEVVDAMRREDITIRDAMERCGVTYAAAWLAKTGETWQPSAPTTECPHGHQYTPENTYVGLNGSKQCRQCARDRQKKAQAEGRRRPSSHVRDGRPCADCGEPLRRDSSSRGNERCWDCELKRRTAEHADRDRQIEAWWNEGLTARQIGEKLGWTREHVAAEVRALRKRGFSLPRRKGVA